MNLSSKLLNALDRALGQPVQNATLGQPQRTATAPRVAVVGPSDPGPRPDSLSGNLAPGINAMPGDPKSLMDHARIRQSANPYAGLEHDPLPSAALYATIVLNNLSIGGEEIAPSDELEVIATAQREHDRLDALRNQHHPSQARHLHVAERDSFEAALNGGQSLPPIRSVEEIEKSLTASRRVINEAIHRLEVQTWTTIRGWHARLQVACKTCADYQQEAEERACETYGVPFDPSPLLRRLRKAQVCAGDAMMHNPIGSPRSQAQGIPIPDL